MQANDSLFAFVICIFLSCTISCTKVCGCCILSLKYYGLFSACLQQETKSYELLRKLRTTAKSFNVLTSIKIW